MSYTITISAFEQESSIGRMLHPNTPFRFKSIMGELYSLSNGMFFMNTVNFKIKWLNEELTSARYKAIRKSPKKNVPNYWEVVKLLIVDRILQDGVLLDKLMKEIPQDTENIYFKPVVKIKRGVLTSIIKNDKLHIYGVILSKIVKIIRNSFKENNIEDIYDVDEIAFSKAIKDIKEQVWTDALERSNGQLLASINDSVTNEDLYRAFMSIPVVLDKKDKKEEE